MSKRSSLGGSEGSAAKASKPNEPEEDLCKAFLKLQLDILKTKDDKDELEIEIRASPNAEKITIEIRTTSARRPMLYTKDTHGEDFVKKSITETLDFLKKCQDHDKCIDGISMWIADGCKGFVEMFYSQSKSLHLSCDDLYVEHPKAYTGVWSILECIDYNRKAWFEVLEAKRYSPPKKDSPPPTRDTPLKPSFV